MSRREEPVNRSDNPTFASVLEARLSRRRLLTGAVAGVAAAACAPVVRPRVAADHVGAAFTPVAPSTADTLVVPRGYRAQVLLRWGDPLFPGAPGFDPAAQTAAGQARQFGYDNDFIGYVPLPRGSGSSISGLLGVNHESARAPLMWPQWNGQLASKTREMVDVEIAAHGFTVVEVRRRRGGEWSYVSDSPYNRRVTGSTPMVLRGPAAGHPLLRTSADPAGLTVLGTLNNCAGGVTPWGTFLSGEENLWLYFEGKPDEVADAGLRALHQRYGIGAARYGWGRHHGRFDLRREPHEPNRFGWVVEIDPYESGSVPVKHTALGRMAHEGATVIIAASGRPVVYMGDDARFEYLYKFVAEGRYDPGHRAGAHRLLERGTLWVARFHDDGTGDWRPLVFGPDPLTEAAGFRSQAEVMINARRAADLLGATKMDRPEDVEPSPVTGKVYAVMTGNERRTAAQVDKANPRAGVKYGHIIELIEDGGDHTAARFRWDMFILAGDPNQPAQRAAYQGRTDVDPFAMPDNIAFDDVGRMWVATDGNDDTLGPNDGVWVVDTEGPERGRARQFLSGPIGAELCGPAFTPDCRTLFVAVQHPGLVDKVTYDKPGSRFPDYRPGMPPRPCVLAIYREAGGRGQGGVDLSTGGPPRQSSGQRVSDGLPVQGGRRVH
jgi:secreted PhoX family phosphatase